jgi:predicted amidohydrolase
MSKPDLFIDPIPMNLVWNDPNANLQAMRSEITSRLKKSAQIDSKNRIFVFPELTLTGFVTENPELSALEREHEAVQGVRNLASEFKTSIVFGFPERQEGVGSPWNTLVFIDPMGRELGDYQKMHLFTAGSPSEHSTYEAGTSGTIIEFQGWKIAFGICFDLRFPQLFQAYARESADLVILPACWVGGPGKSHQFQTLSAAHAIAGQYYFLSVNRAGSDPHFPYEGEALLYSPRGEQIEGDSPYKLTEEALLQARKLSVRVSDRESYPVVKSVNE